MPLFQTKVCVKKKNSTNNGLNKEKIWYISTFKANLKTYSLMFCLPLSIKQLSITQEFRLEAKLFFVGRLELQKFCRKKSLFSYIFQLQMKFVSVPSEVLCLHRKILFLLGCICSCQSFMFSQRIPSCSGSVVSVPARVLCFHKGFLAVPARLFPFLPEFYVFTKDS